MNKTSAMIIILLIILLFSFVGINKYYEKKYDIIPYGGAGCAKEFETFNRIDINTTCCENLTPISPQWQKKDLIEEMTKKGWYTREEIEKHYNDYNISEDECIYLGPDHGSAQITCMNCGDGKCIAPENSCTCSIDCAN